MKIVLTEFSYSFFMFLLTIGNSYLSYGQYITTYTIFCIIIIRIYQTTIFSGRESTNLNIFEQIYLFTAFINIEYFLEKSQSAMCFLSKSYYIKHGKTNKNKLINKRLFYSQWSLLWKDMLTMIYYHFWTLVQSQIKPEENQLGFYSWGMLILVPFYHWWICNSLKHFSHLNINNWSPLLDSDYLLVYIDV